MCTISFPIFGKNNHGVKHLDFRDFRKAGHWPTLLAAFLYFGLSFTAWVALGPLIIYIAKDITLTVDDKFTLVAIPILSGALLRIPLGALADHFGGKRSAIAAQMLMIAGLAWAWVSGLDGKLDIALLGLVLGVAGASFAVALPQASRWYPPHYQGIVMGIAGAGNMCVVLTSLTAPWLAETLGWRNVFGVLLALLLALLIVYALIAKDAPGTRQQLNWAGYRALFGDRDSWWFMLFYFITFGGFVGLANVLVLYFTVQYHVSGIAAGLMVSIIVLLGSLARPIGGMVADRIGGIRSLQFLFIVVAASYTIIAFMPSGPVPFDPAAGGWSFWQIPNIAWISLSIFTVSAMALGMGNGAVFQLIPQRFRNEIGAITGLVGCGGGAGGFFLAKALGLSQAWSGNFSGGFMVFALLALLGLAGLVSVKRRWRTTWGAVSGARI